MKNTPDPITLRLMLDTINKNQNMKAFLLTYLHGSARRGVFSAEDFREMMNSPISNVFQRMVYTGVSMIENLKALVRHRIEVLIHNLDLKAARKHARKFDYSDYGYEPWSLHIDHDAPIQSLKKLAIKVKEGIFASRLELLTEALSQATSNLADAKRYYGHVMQQYSLRMEHHFTEYENLARQYNLVDELKLSQEQIASLHAFYHQYHQEQSQAQQNNVLRVFFRLTPAPRFRNTAQFEDRVRDFLHSDELRERMIQHNEEHRYYGNILSQVSDAIIYYQHATIALQSELNFTMKLWQMKNPNFEYTPKAGTRGLVNQEEDQRVMVPEARAITPFQMQPRPNWLVETA